MLHHGQSKSWLLYQVWWTELIDGLHLFLTHMKIPFPPLSVSPYPIPCLLQSWWVTVLFTAGLVLWQTVPLTHQRFLRQEHHLISLFASLPLSSVVCFPFIHRELTPLARPFACFVRGDGDANVRKCILSIICATRFSTSGLFTLYLVLP